MNYTKSYLTNVSLKLGSGALGFVLSTASTVVIARTLGPEGNGTVVLLILIPTMIASFASLGLESANGYLAGARKHTPQSLIRNSLTLSVTISLLLGIVYWLAIPISMRFLSDSNITVGFLALAFIIVPFTLLEMYLRGVLLGLERIAQLSIVSIVRFSSLLVLNVALVVILKLGVLGALWAAAITPAICVILSFFFLRNDAKFRLGFDRKALKGSLVFGIQAHLGTVLNFFDRRLDVFIVNFFTGVANVGLYAVATSLAELLWYFPSAFGFVLFPRIASSDPDTAKRFTPKVARLTMLITTVAAVGLFLTSRLVITVFYTEEYLPSLYPLWILLPGVISISYSQILFNDLGGRGKPYFGTIASLISVFVTLGADVLLIPRFGIIGAATATSLAYMTNAAVAIYSYVRVSGNRLTDVLFIRKSDIGAGLSLGWEMATSIKKSFHVRRLT